MSALLHPAPGSTAWLLRHEVRLAWRAIGGGRRESMTVILALLGVVAHGAAWFLLGLWPRGPLPPIATLIIGAAAWMCISLMLSQAILMSVSALFDRGDLDLLLASPVSTRSVFMARGLGIAFNSGVLYLCLLAPFAHVGLFLGHPELLAVYPVVVGLALGVTALGMALTLLIVGLVGARRARTVAQVLGTLVGAAVFLSSQLGNLIGPSAAQALGARLEHWAAPGGPLAPESAVWLPARALLGDLPALVAVLALGALSLWLVVALTHRRFLAGTQESVSGSARRGSAAPPRGSSRFRAGLWRNMLRKEWRLILRDPQLIAQTLMQLLYLVPSVLVLVRSGDHSLARAIPGLVLLAGWLANSLAWITVAAEDAPDLLQASPNSMTRIRLAKVLAAMLPVWLLVSPVLVYLAAAQPRLALVFMFCTAGCTLSSGAGQIWYPRQGRRADMKRRGHGHGVLNIMEFLVMAGWAGTAWCLAAQPVWALLTLLLTGLAMGAVRLMGQPRREGRGAG